MYAFKTHKLLHYKEMHVSGHLFDFHSVFYFQFEDYKQDLRQVIHGNNKRDGVYITLRMRLRCEIFRNGKAMPGKVFDILNEVVVDRGSNPYLSKIECYEHERLITKVSLTMYLLSALQIGIHLRYSLTRAIAVLNLTPLNSFLKLCCALHMIIVMSLRYKVME